MKQTLLFSLLALLPVGAWADTYQDPETKVNYEYTVGQSEASVKAGSYSAAGSPDATGDIAILAAFSVDGNEYSVTRIGDWAFVGCSGLTSVTIPNSVTSIGWGAFCGCSGLTSVTVEAGNTVYDSRNDCNAIIETKTNELIAGCQNTVIPNSVTSIGGGAFEGCSGLTSITIPNSVTSIGVAAFAECCGLTSITLPNSLTSIRYSAFSGCSGLTSITIPNSVTSIGELAFWGCSSLTSVTISNSVTSIESCTFKNCSGLTSVTIPGSVTSIGQEAFRGCSSLTSVTISESVTSIGLFTFIECSGLTSIVVEEGNNVFDSRDNSNAIIKTETNELMVGCMNTTIPESVTSIGEYAFEGCSGLTSVTIPNSVTSIGWHAFGGCSGLTSITVPSSVTSIEFQAFNGCSSLTSIVVEEGNRVYDSRDNSNAIIKTETNELIAGCQNTVIPNSVTSIGGGAFSGCSSLTSITIPNSVTSIRYSAFYGCSGLTSITIPNSVTSIGNYAFEGCSGLTEVRSFIVEPFTIDTNVFPNASQATLYVPIGTKALYEATDGWKEFANIVEMDLDPTDGGEVSYGEGGSINGETDLSGTVVNNMYYSIGTDAGGYNAEEGCIVITRETSDEQMELLQGLGITDEELNRNFTGIIFKVPAGEGVVKVNAETTGNMTLKVKVGNAKTMEMELEGKLKMKFPYNVSEESLVYIFAGTTDEAAARGAAEEPSSLKIYGIEWQQTRKEGDLNGDGNVDVGDIMAIINYMANPVDPEAPAASSPYDLNGDGSVDVGDIMAIINIMAQ